MSAQKTKKRSKPNHIGDTRDRKLTLVEHLHELRYRIIVSVIAVIVATCFGYTVRESILSHLMKPVGKLVFISPTELFFTHLKLSFWSGVFLSLPVLLFQCWRFVSVGLYQREKKYLLLFGPLSFLLFVVGGAFAYLIAVPFGLKFLLGFATETIQPMISVSKYISFLGVLLFAFGIMFELPLVVVFLTKIGVVTPALLSAKRKYVIVMIFIVSAIFTPPDPFTQILLALPLMFLYEVSILLSKLMSKGIVEE